MYLYIHFPYCLYKCHYCDFNSYAVSPSAALFDEYLQAVVRELYWRIRSGHAFAEGTALRTIFIGGGTPSLLSPKQVSALMRSIDAVYPRSHDCEVTIECNPKTLSADKLNGFQEVGINRLSIGIQSFEDRYLAPLGRIHTGREAFDTLTLVQESGFPNVNTDLIFGFPGQTVEEVQSDLKKATSFGFGHLSFYSLTPEKGTLFYRDVAAGNIQMPGDDVQREMMIDGIATLTADGFHHYEVSNFYREGGAPSRHNLAYWDYQSFLGLGAGASSFLYQGAPFKGRRHVNGRSPALYMKKAGVEPTYDEEAIDAPTAMREWLMMGLRKREGVSLSQFTALFGVPFYDYFAPPLLRLQQNGLLTLADNHLIATEAGLYHLDNVIAEFF